DETKITAMGHKGNLSEASTSSYNHSSNSDINHNAKERDELFHIRVIAKHTKIHTLIDSGSQVNLIFEEVFLNEVVLDVIPLDICGIVLGSPYLYDGNAIFFREDNKYHLKKDGVEYIIRSHKVKTNLSLVNVGQMKRLINSSCDPKHKDELVKLITNYSEVFQTPKGLPPKREIAHEIYLQ
ncbi:unnamed protein product, partial [Adineta steineri]